MNTRSTLRRFPPSRPLWRIPLVAFLVGLALVVAAATLSGKSVARLTSGSAAPTREAVIARAIRDLDSDDAETFRRAEAILSLEGEAAREALVAATADAARAAAAKRLLAELDELRKLPPVEVAFLTRAYCYGGSAIPDKNALGGFGPSDNFPRALTNHVSGAGKVYLLAKPDERSRFAGKYRGFALYLVNATDGRVAFAAADSRLSIVREAKDETGQWKEIEYLPQSWCGNSYHRVLLDPDQGWRFVVPEYAGSFKTTMRFKLLPDRDGGQPTYSNEFEGSIAPEQFTPKKQGHTPTDITDPYLE